MNAPPTFGSDLPTPHEVAFALPRGWETYIKIEPCPAYNERWTAYRMVVDCNGMAVSMRGIDGSYTSVGAAKLDALITFGRALPVRIVRPCAADGT